MNILILIVSVSLGFALACLIFAVILSGSNDIGNSTAMAEDYKIDIAFDVSRNRLDINPGQWDEADSFCLQNFENINPDPEDPEPDKPVEQLPGKQIELEDITAIYVDG